MKARNLRSVPQLLLLLAPLLTACAPLMIESEGHRIFNPVYRGFLTWGLRDSWQRPEEVIAALAIRPGQVVADVGAGNGYFVDELAAAVGAEGRVYATEVQQIMLEDLHALVAKGGLANVEVIEAEFDDPSLPSACCDLVFFANVYKEIQDRVPYMHRVGRTLRGGGRVAILGFRKDVRGPGPPPGARLSAEKVIEELGRAGFRSSARHDFLPRQYLLIFELGEAGSEPLAN